MPFPEEHEIGRITFSVNKSLRRLIVFSCCFSVKKCQNNAKIMSICYQRNDEICRITFSVNKSRKRLIVCRPKHEFLKRPIRHLQFNWNYYLGHSSLVNYLARGDIWKKLTHPTLLHFTFGRGTMSTMKNIKVGFLTFKRKTYTK